LAVLSLCVVIGFTAPLAMASESVSFRISRNAEDLAQTVHALSQRLVKLEQRLAAMELQLDRQVERDPQEITSLDNVERLLLDCRALLDMSEHLTGSDAGLDDGADQADQDDAFVRAA
jgi:uncharacterized membrane protein YccC